MKLVKDTDAKALKVNKVSDQEAEEAVNCIKKGDIATLKNLAKPPGDVVMVGSVICIFFGIKPEKVMDKANPG